jgi:hypothetical protein
MSCLMLCLTACEVMAFRLLAQDMACHLPLTSHKLWMPLLDNIGVKHTPEG